MAKIESLAELYLRPGFMVKRLHQVATAIFLEECGRYSMTPSQYQALCALSEHTGIDQSALGKLIGQDRSTVSLVVQLLLERGLIRRLADPRDKRRSILSLSESGMQTLREVAPAAKRAQNRLLAALPEEQRAGFLALLRTLLDAHGAEIDPGAVIAGSAAAQGPRSRIRRAPRPTPRSSSSRPARKLPRTNGAGKLA
ncbi:MAG: MarR family transcriptional regulator [Betaproteobacteria bacterium]|nr:MarR family transcriptional regulator [Betaproteobacteria bacterium]